MNLLALETSSPVLSAAVKKGSGRTLETKVRGAFSHAENLLPVIDRLLKRRRLRIQDIDAFLIGRGPGSFTGLRIGFATLKGFLAVQKKPCYGAMSLDLIAENVKLEDGAGLSVALDAYREKIYARFYHRQDGGWVATEEPAVLGFSEWLESLPADIHVAGDALARHEKGIEKFGKRSKWHRVPEAAWFPCASVMISWSEKLNRSRGGGTPPLQKLEKPEDFIPLYFRLSEAEEKTKAHALTG